MSDNFQPQEKSRLSTLQAALVIARRDFVAILFSRAFFFFLLGPLFPVLVGGLAGGIGSQVQREAASSEIGVVMTPPDFSAMELASQSLRPQLGGVMPQFSRIETLDLSAAQPDPRKILEERRGNYAAIVSGTPEKPVLTGPAEQVSRWQGVVALVAATATQNSPSAFPAVTPEIVSTSGASVRADRIKTAQAAQMLLFLLTMLLAGMVLSNLVEEKANKIIEILAAAIPMDAVFFGKLVAMLGVSFVGISVWGLCGSAVALLAGSAIPAFPAPAVGWPLFFALGVAYFSTAYLLLGSLFLTIGAMASTVREVQTLSMPVTMMQLMVFFLASFAMTQPGSVLEMFAVAFPLSSPFAMLARAAQQPELWPHALALAWQAVAVVLIVRGGAALFRKRVMKSGNAGRPKRKWLAIRNRTKGSAIPAR